MKTGDLIIKYKNDYIYVRVDRAIAQALRPFGYTLQLTTFLNKKRTLVFEDKDHITEPEPI